MISDMGYIMKNGDEEEVKESNENFVAMVPVNGKIRLLSYHTANF
jgi:hypothetical protein